MNATRKNIRLEQGFAAYIIGNQQVEIAVVPELGAKIISLKNLQTAREWMWHPQAGMKLFENRPSDDFARSPLVGADECIPTIAPCTWRGRKLPDHGEAWSLGWRVDCEAWQNGVLKTTVQLPISPFEFSRTIELQKDEIRLTYKLYNRSADAEPYLWALHPLIALQTGDRIEIPTQTRTLLNGESWIDAIDSAVPNGKCAKVFARPVNEGVAAICNKQTGDRLEFEWDPAENNTLGVWLSRGGWHGHHHFALEPTNGDGDALSMVAERKGCGIVPGSSQINWELRLRVKS